MDKTWIKLYRILLKKPIWKRSTPQQKVVLVTLLLMANHAPNEWEWKGKKFTVEPGSFVTSLESIRNKAGFGISIQNVRSSLKRFEKFEFLTNKATKEGRIISITNWHGYQPNQQGPQQSKQQRPNKGATKTQHLTRMEESKNLKNRSNGFDRFWEIYPKKKGKGAALKAWKKIKTPMTMLPIILKAVEDQKKTEDWKKNHGQYIPHPATWLNQGRWEDEVEKQDSYKPNYKTPLDGLTEKDRFIPHGRENREPQEIDHEDTISKLREQAEAIKESK